MTDGCGCVFNITLVQRDEAAMPGEDAARGVDHVAGLGARPVAIREHDQVGDSGVASFPASDPPSWWSGR
jgi:hypothetical protein